MSIFMPNRLFLVVFWGAGPLHQKLKSSILMGLTYLLGEDGGGIQGGGGTVVGEVLGRF